MLRVTRTLGSWMMIETNLCLMVSQSISPAFTILLFMLYMSGTSAKRHEGSELCSILNRALREDDPIATVHAAVFANAINILLVETDGVRSPQPWLKQVFRKSFPYVIGYVGKLPFYLFDKFTTLTILLVMSYGLEFCET